MTTKQISLECSGADFLSMLNGATPAVTVLTTDHPASSYGLPVVLVDGQPVSPAECARIVAAETCDAYRAKCAAGDEETSCAPYDAETLALLAAARRAGYVVAVKLA